MEFFFTNIKSALLLNWNVSKININPRAKKCEYAYI